jgi:hypothetical protein
LRNGGAVGFERVIVVNPAKYFTLVIAVNQSGSNPAAMGGGTAWHLP